MTLHGPRDAESSVKDRQERVHTAFRSDIGRPSGERSECEHTCWDPKDGELCLNRVKPGETLVEARSDSDVQIDRQIWV